MKKIVCKLENSLYWLFMHIYRTLYIIYCGVIAVIDVSRVRFKLLRGRCDVRTADLIYEAIFRTMVMKIYANGFISYEQMEQVLNNFYSNK